MTGARQLKGRHIVGVAQVAARPGQVERAAKSRALAHLLPMPCARVEARAPAFPLGSVQRRHRVHRLTRRLGASRNSFHTNNLHKGTSLTNFCVSESRVRAPPWSQQPAHNVHGPTCFSQVAVQNFCPI